MYEKQAAVVAIAMSFLFFWAPILVSISALILSVFYYKSYYLRDKPNANVSKRVRPNTTQSVTSDNRFGSNVRHIKTARRTISFRNTNTDNYSLNYLTEPLNAKYFQQSDSLLASTSGVSSGSRPTSAADVSYFGYRPPSVSPTSHLGNMPFVKLSSSGSEAFTPELKRKPSPVKPVTVRIAPMPQNYSKLTLNRLSSTTAPTAPTLGVNSIPKESSMQTKAVVDALKKSLRRKREPKSEVEVEDSVVSANKKAKREATDPIIDSNGSIPSKQPVKRQAIDSSDTIFKRFKNNEIFSSFSSSPQLSQQFNNKRKLSPESKRTNETKIMKSGPKEEEMLKINTNDEIKFGDSLTFDFFRETQTQQTIANPREEIIPKRAYGLPLHLHSMEDHQRDQNKTKHRLNRFLSAVKEATSPKNDEKSSRLTTTIEAVATSESEQRVANDAAKSVGLAASAITSEIGLPDVPAAAIFTNSRVETSVTTTLLNTPISSVLTTNKESMRSSLSPQIMTPESSVANVVTQTVTSTESARSVDQINTLNPMNTVLTQNSSAAPMANWPSTLLFTAKPEPQSQPNLFSVGAGGSTTRRTAQNSRLRVRQRR